MRLGFALLSLLALSCARETPSRTPSPPPPAPSPAGPPAPTTPVVLVAPSPDFDVVDLVLDEQRVYFAHRGERGLESVPLAGGAETTLVRAGDQPITSLAADATFLYYTSGRRVGAEQSAEILGKVGAHAGHFEGYVARIRKDGSSREELATGRFDPDNVALDGPLLCWVMVRPKEGTLVRLAPGTDSPAVVAHGQFAPESVIAHGGRAYWIDPTAGPAVMMVPLAGGEPQKLAQGEAGNPVHPVRLAADDEAVYWTDSGPSELEGAIVKVPVGQGAASLLAQGLHAPRGIGVWGGFAYWVEKGTAAGNFRDGTLRKVSTRGGAPVTLSSGLVAPDRLAVSGDRVVWTELDGSVRTMAR